jgi:MmyB-like transcription regulator ligand binding domain
MRPAALPPESIAIVPPPRAPRAANTARFVSSPSRTADLFTAGTVCIASEMMGYLRSQAAPDEHNRGLSDLVRQLSTQSEALRARWAARGFSRLRLPAVPPRPALAARRSIRPGAGGRIRYRDGGLIRHPNLRLVSALRLSTGGMSACGNPGQALARTLLSRSCLPRRAAGRRAVARSHPGNQASILEPNFSPKLL